MDKAKTLVQEILAKNLKNEMLAAVQNTMEKNEAIKTVGKRYGSLDVADRKRVMEGATIFRSLCATCHGADAKGLPTKIAPSLVDDVRRIFMGSKDTTIRILLHGLTGPINGKKYPTDMPPMGSNNDEWIASVLSYLRYDLGVPEQYAGSIPPQYFPQLLVRPEEVQKVRAQTAERNKPWTQEELKKGQK